MTLQLAAMAFFFSAPSRALIVSTPLSQYGHDVWDSDSGLPQNSVDAIVQTRDGYLWLGTQEGLVRFDGVRFTIFDSRNARAIRDDWVTSLREARDGTLWVGTSEGLLQMKDGRFGDWQPGGVLASGRVSTILEGHDGTLWVGSHHGLVRIRNREIRVLTEKDGLPATEILSAAEDSEGRLWVGSRRGAVLLNGESLQPVLDDLQKPVTALSSDGKDGMWVGTPVGLGHWSRSGGMRSYGREDGLSNVQIRSLYHDREGTLWVGTEGGLFRFTNDRFEALTRENGGLSSGEVGALCEDREGSLWVGTRDGGLNRLKDERIANFTIRQGLPDDRVWSVFEDRSGTLWVGTVDGGLSRLRPGTTTIDRFSNLQSAVLSIDQDTDGDLWVGTFATGLFRIHGNQIRHYSYADGFRPTHVSAICADRRGGVWIGSAGMGVFSYRHGKFIAYTDRDGLGSNAVTSIFQDRQDAIWVGTFGGGVSRIENGRLDTLTTKNGLAHNIVMSVFEDSLGTFWFGTRGGLSRLSGGKFTTYRQSSGLFHDAVQKVLSDDHGYLWLTSNHGIFRVSLAELAAVARGSGGMVHPVGFTTANGMRSVECNNGQHGGFQGHDGRLWFATLRGLAMADPSRIQLNTVPPKVVIETIVAGRQTWPGTARLFLPPSVRDLEFDYTALSFRNPNAIRFRYQLEGFDRRWIEAGARRVAYYTNLPPGRYRFRVLASNEDGFWSPESAVEDLTLERSLIEATWFRLMCLLAATGLVWSGYRFRIRRLAAREALRAAVFEAKLSALQAQLQPHFLFNALNAILPLVGSDPARARRMILRIGDLLRESLLAEATPLVTLERDLELLGEYLEIERMRFQDRIEVNVHAAADTRSACVPSFVLQPLVENAIKHAADPRTGRVRIWIEAWTEEATLCLQLRDDGPGLPMDADILRQGIGLRNIKQRLETLFPGNHAFRLTSPEGGGCEVLIQMPLVRAGDEENGEPWEFALRAGKVSSVYSGAASS